MLHSDDVIEDNFQSIFQSLFQNLKSAQSKQDFSSLDRNKIMDSFNDLIMIAERQRRDASVLSEAKIALRMLIENEVPNQDIDNYAQNEVINKLYNFQDEHIIIPIQFNSTNNTAGTKTKKQKSKKNIAHSESSPLINKLSQFELSQFENLGDPLKNIISYLPYNPDIINLRQTSKNLNSFVEEKTPEGIYFRWVNERIHNYKPTFIQIVQAHEINDPVINAQVARAYGIHHEIIAGSFAGGLFGSLGCFLSDPFTKFFSGNISGFNFYPTIGSVLGGAAGVGVSGLLTFFGSEKTYLKMVAAGVTVVGSAAGTFTASMMIQKDKLDDNIIWYESLGAVSGSLLLSTFGMFAHYIGRRYAKQDIELKRYDLEIKKQIREGLRTPMPNDFDYPEINFKLGK